jgi:hypothetical protein
MNNLDKQYQTLLQEYKIAKNMFQIYSIKVTYGEIGDREFNSRQANDWDRIIQDLRNKISSYES